MAQAIFKSWFVDFELWGGVMPDDWREGTLSEIANITMGQSPDGKSYNEDGTGTVFYQGRAEFGSRFPTRRLFTTEPKRMAAKGDVLMSVRGCR
jgi:type I restriction enzyme S subunit